MAVKKNNGKAVYHNGNSKAYKTPSSPTKGRAKASGKVGGAGAKSSASPIKGTGGKRVAPPVPPADPLKSEILAIIAAACGCLLLISLFTESGSGFLGGVINGALKGIVGAGAYLLPFVIILLSILAVFNIFGGAGLYRVLLVCGLFGVFVSFAHIVSYLPGSETGWEYVKAAYLNGGGKNGGALGAILGGALTGLLGKMGAYVALFAFTVTLLILLTGKSLFGFIGSTAAKFGDAVHDSRERRAYEREGAAALDYEEWEDFEGYERDDGKGLMEEEIFSKPLKMESFKKRTKPRPVEADAASGSKVFNYVLEEGEVIQDGDRLHLIRPADGGKAKSPKKIIFDGGQGKLKNNVIKENDSEDKEFELDLHMDSEREREMEGEEGFIGDEEDVSRYEEPSFLRPGEPPIDREPGEISIKGTGVEGYVPKAVTDGEGGEGLPAKMDPLSVSTLDAPLETLEEYEYVFPPVELLKENNYVPSLSSKAQILENSRKLEETLKSFGVEARVVEVSKGPTVTRYELSPGSGVKVSKISGLADDLALNLAAAGIRIEAPIPGKSVVGIEIPNKEVQSVFLREVIDDESFWKSSSKLTFALGKDIAGNPVISDIAKMPHLLIAGATGAGKSVCINTLITSIIYKARPEEVKLIMIDPKVVELSVYNGIPHLMIPVVTDPKKASGALNWAVKEMDLRYNMFAETVTRDLKGYNGVRAKRGEMPLPQIVIIIDELADLMMTCGKEVEDSICRLAQKARAAGIHLIIATQRPSVDVITGLIKANVPSRLAFAVSSGTDSRTILDSVGAEKLLGKGDMLFHPAGMSKPLRVQGSFISDKEVENIVNFIKVNSPEEYDPKMIEKITASGAENDFGDEGADEFMDEAMSFLVDRGKASTSMLQRRFRIGYNRAARMIEELEKRGIVGPEDGSKPRKVLMTKYEYEEYRSRRTGQ